MDVMIEWALALFRRSDLADLPRHLRFETAPHGRQDAQQAEARAAAIEAFGPPAWTRLYFGHEFCERRAPAVDDVRRAYEAASSAGLAFSLLTGYVTDQGLDRLRPVLAWLAGRDDPHIEIVANDWGVVRVVTGDHAALRPVLGRLMNRMLRDPRIMPGFVGAPAPGDALAAVRQSSISAPVFRRLLARLGVERVEFDNLIQGLDMDFAGLGVAASVYVPYGYVVTGRVCAIGSLGQPASDRFHVGADCRRECQRYTITRQASASPFDGGHREYLERGNTCCYYQDRSAIASAGEMAQQAGISRVVYQTDLPV